jgi:hypothetical protein
MISLRETSSLAWNHVKSAYAVKAITRNRLEKDLLIKHKSLSYSGDKVLMIKNSIITAM